MDETANEIKRLQGCINDLISVLALPAMWTGQDSEQIVSTLLDVLVGMLRLDFAYVRLNHPMSGDLIEVVRHDPLRPLAADSRSVGQTFNDSFGVELRKWPPRARNPFGDGNLSIVPLGSGRENDIGVIVAASQRADFPWQTETVLLNVASNQAAIGLASARAYGQERLRGEALAQIDRVKMQFFSNVSHEFRTPLTLLLGPLEEVLSEASIRLGPEHHQQLLMVRRNALRLLKLVNTLLDFSRIDAGRAQATYEPTDLASFTSEIASAFDSAIASAGLRFSVECQPITEPVYVDRDMWEKVVLNLLSNAFKFTFEGEIAVTLKAVDGTVELQVRDTGVGIPDDQRERVFERFHRIEGVHARTYEGTGIGLALVQELVRLHGGSVRVESALGEGSTFTVAIPSGKAHLPAERIQAAQSFTSTKIRAEAYVKEAQQWFGDESGAADDVAMLGKLPLLTSSPDLKPAAKRELIILADDNTDMRRYLQRLLTDRYEVHAVADGSQALEATRQLRPALVLADVMMPRMDGFALLRAIRDDSTLCSTPVILVSARAGEESRVEGLQADADDYLVKPFTSRELMARVATHVKMAHLRRVTAEREERLRSETELERQKLNASQELLAETSRFYRELQNREAKIRRLVEANVVGIVMWNLDGAITGANDAFLRMVGYDREDLASGRVRWTDLTPPEWRDQDERAIADLNANGVFQPCEKEYFRKDGSRVPILIGGAFFKDSGNEGVAFILDLSERKRAETEIRALKDQLYKENLALRDEVEHTKRAEADLKQAYLHFSEAQRLSKTGSFISDLLVDQHIWSEELRRICEFDPNARVTVQMVRDIIHPEDVPLYEAAVASGMTGKDVDFVFRIVTSRGVVKHLRGIARVTELIAGRPLFSGAIQDVTEMKVAEQALNRARSELAHITRVTTLNALTASIAHEVNQPLSGIITNASTCRRMLDGDPPNVEGARETARRIVRDGNRASDVITRLRALFSKKEFTLEPLDLNEATREVIALSLSDLQRNRVILQSELADDLPPVTGDRVQLQQVILNLLRNASDAMNTVEDRPRQLLIRTERDEEDRVRLSVKDVGVGFRPEAADKLFEAFYTTKSDGMGIGLSVSRSIIESHNGCLWAARNDGPGATFQFTLPTETKASSTSAG